MASTIWLSLSCLVILACGGESYPLCRLDETQACLESKEPDCCDFLRYQAHDTACLCLMLHLQLEEYGCYDFDPKLVQCKIRVENINCKFTSPYAKPPAYENSLPDAYEDSPIEGEDSGENTQAAPPTGNSDEDEGPAHGCPKPKPEPEPKPLLRPSHPPMCPPHHDPEK